MKKPEISMGEFELEPGFFPIALLAGNGKSMDIRIPENIIPVLTAENIEKAVLLLRDAFYRVRPDLRKQ